MKISLNHTLQIPLHHSTHKVFKSHVKSSQADPLYSSVHLVPVPSELTAHGSRYLAVERTWTFSKHINTWSLSSQSIGASVGSTENTGSSIVACLLSYCLATRWSNLLQYGPLGCGPVWSGSKYCTGVYEEDAASIFRVEENFISPCSPTHMQRVHRHILICVREIHFLPWYANHWHLLFPSASPWRVVGFKRNKEIMIKRYLATITNEM
jgi:hypothetical protein